MISISHLSVAHQSTLLILYEVWNLNLLRTNYRSLRLPQCLARLYTSSSIKSDRHLIAFNSTHLKWNILCSPDWWTSNEVDIMKVKIGHKYEFRTQTGFTVISKRMTTHQKVLSLSVSLLAWHVNGLCNHLHSSLHTRCDHLYLLKLERLWINGIRFYENAKVHS